MSPKLISGVLLFLLLLIQYPLWFGKGGLLRVKELEGQLKEQATINDSLRLRNQQLQGDVGSLADGVEAIVPMIECEWGHVLPGDNMTVSMCHAAAASSWLDEGENLVSADGLAEYLEKVQL